MDATNLDSPSIIRATNPHDRCLQTSNIDVLPTLHHDKFDDEQQSIAVNSKVYLEEKEGFHQTSPLQIDKDSFFSHFKPYKEGFCYRFPFTFCHVTSLQTIYVLVALQLITEHFQPCHAAHPGDLFYLRDIHGDALSPYLQTSHEAYSSIGMQN